MTPKDAPRRVAVIGNFPPRRCGIATFTQNLAVALGETAGIETVQVYAMDDGSMTRTSEARLIAADEKSAYRDAAQEINSGGFDAVSIQHEFGIFGGRDGEYILHLIDELKAPIVPTLHTLLTHPSESQRETFEHILQSSERLVTMTRKGMRILQEFYATDPRRIDVIPHGVPQFDPKMGEVVRCDGNLRDRPLVLTFGLLSRGKGLEYAIRGMRKVVDRHSDALLCILGATHPNLIKHEGEAYRHELESLAGELNLSENVRFVNRFVTEEELIQWLSACDIYVAPYPNLQQVTSGTLAYAVASHTAVVSTPFWHAVELLQNGRGVLVPERSSDGLGDAIADLIESPQCRNRIADAAAQLGGEMAWPNVASMYNASFDAAVSGSLEAKLVTNNTLPSIPAASFESLERMSDERGLFQHGNGLQPDLEHGYCTDDNGRALGVTSQLLEMSPLEPRHLMLATRYLEFVQDAYIPEKKWFRNFRSSDGPWLDEGGSEDCQARTLLALAIAADCGPYLIQADSDALFREAVESLEQIKSLRGMAFGILALHRRLSVHRSDLSAQHLFASLSNQLYCHYVDQATPDWQWFEPKLSYDNARLAQALLLAGESMKSDGMLRAGEQSLTWLMKIQTSTYGDFAPIGSEGFYERGSKRAWFGQQPLEVWATVAACRTAGEVSRKSGWHSYAEQAYSWLFGKNMRGIVMADEGAGHCHDGLEKSGRSKNVGAESILSYLGTLVEMKAIRSQEVPIPIAS